MLKSSIKNRLIYYSAVILVIALGLSVRKFSACLPVFVSQNGGDMLWAAMVYLGFRSLFLRKPLAWSAFSAVSFSYLIEFSQLYQTTWLNNLRHTTLGALVFGQGFLLIDLVRYTAGILMVYYLDNWLIKSHYLK